MRKNHFIISILFFFISSIASAQISPVIISEVFYDTTEPEYMTDSTRNILPHHNGEFVELFNPSSLKVDISGWTIGDMEGSFKFPGNTFLNPRSTILVVFKHPLSNFKIEDLFLELNLTNTSACVFYHAGFWMSNEAEIISLYDQNQIDLMSYKQARTLNKEKLKRIQNYNLWDIYARNGN